MLAWPRTPWPPAGHRPRAAATRPARKAAWRDAVAGHCRRPSPAALAPVHFPCLFPATRARGRNFTQPNQTPRAKPNRRRGSSKASAGRGRHRAAAMSALQSWRKAYALKDSTTVSLANLNSD
ncbi:hypothetical protein PVAP13_1NG161419 [Panicum virgatum]|uniref:Uncharacterized protein n=1 Tax=Panicum virgatum TaxID=38727 RepID=A0A8T0WLI8_PANVG|nr:hypothetical protein PVAP13_1NG161419 [Panicum virgatum]